MGIIQQVHTTVAASYTLLLAGLVYVWPSYTASLYTDKNTTLLSVPMTEVEVSLISSLPSLGAMLGTIITGKVIDIYGRRKGGLILTLPYLLSWIVISRTNSSVVIIIARFVSGIPCGAAFVYGPIFVSEIAQESIRGFLASGPVVFNCLGFLLSYVLGWFLSYQYIIWANVALTCVGLLLIMMVTESPIWLMRQKREADARVAFAHYRGVSPVSNIVIEEISRLKAHLMPVAELTSINVGNNKSGVTNEEKLKIGEMVANTQDNASLFRMLLISTSTRRAFIVAGLTLSLQVMMGMIVVQVYAKDIFSNAAPSLSPHLCSVMLAVILLFGSITSAACLDRFGRQILLVVSSIVVVLCLMSIGLLLQTNVLPAWVTAVFILVYCFAFMLGSGSVPYVLLAELFIPQVQSTASMLLMEWVWLLNFVLLGIFQYIVKYFGIHGAFYFFSVFGFLNTIVGIFLLPETKGMTNDQIQERLLRNKKS